VKNANLSPAAVSDAVGEAWAHGSGLVHDLATSAADLATDLATTVADKAPEIPERVGGLARSARRRLSPAPPPRRWKPWMLVAAVAAAFVAVGWWRRRSSSSSPAVDSGPRHTPNPVREHTDRATSAAGI